MRRIKKYTIVLILFLSMILYTGCAAGGTGNVGSDSDQNPNKSTIEYNAKDFIQVCRFTYNEDMYAVGRLNSFALFTDLQSNDKPNFVYYIEEYKMDNTVNVSNWTINYKQDVTSIICEVPLEEAFVNMVYENIRTSLKEVSLMLDITLDYYYNLFDVEKELLVDMNNEFQSVYVVDLYLPYLLQNQTKNQAYIINVPIKSILAYLNNENLKLILDDEEIEIPYESFISSPYVFK